MRPFRLASVPAAVLVAAMASGCALEIPEHPPRLATIQAARSANLPPLAVGTFTQTSPSVVGKTQMVRGGSLKPPSGDSFPGYLRAVLISELQAAGKYAADSTTVITGELTHSEISSATPMAHAAIAAEFTVTRAGKVVYKRKLDVSHEWESDFIGAIAIPKAMDHYTSLYSDLVGKLIADPEFVRAFAAP